MAFFKLNNTDALTAEIVAAKAIGFDGKIALHPSQVNYINDGFSPSGAELNKAKRVIEAASCSHTNSPITKITEHMVGPPFLKYAQYHQKALTAPYPHDRTY